MLVFSATYHVIDLCESKVRCYREGGLRGLSLAVKQRLLGLFIIIYILRYTHWKAITQISYANEF